jgi:hypothetical protein
MDIEAQMRTRAHYSEGDNKADQDRHGRPRRKTVEWSSKKGVVNSLACELTGCMLRLGRLAGWRLGHLERMVDEIQSCFLHVLDADWVLGLDQSPRFPVCLDRVASCWPRMVLCVFFVICVSLGCAVTEGEVRRCVHQSVASGWRK